MKTNKCYYCQAPLKVAGKKEEIIMRFNNCNPYGYHARCKKRSWTPNLEEKVYAKEA